MQQIAKVFANGRSQAVRLPLEFRFDVAEVFIRSDPLTGDVVLSRKPSGWEGLLSAVSHPGSAEEPLVRRQTSARRDPFEGVDEE